MAKWIQQQESNQESFTKLSSWEELKVTHQKFHISIQEYVDQNASNAKQKQLEKKALQIEENTLEVFTKLNNILQDNCKERSQ